MAGASMQIYLILVLYSILLYACLDRNYGMALSVGSSVHPSEIYYPQRVNCPSDYHET